MAKINNGVTGAFSGAVGNVVGCSWRGIDIMRGKPDHYNDANTIKQQEIRMRFKGLAEFCKSILKSIIRPIWEPKNKVLTGTNSFMKANYDAFNEEGELADYTKLQLSVGGLGLPKRFFVSADTTTKGTYNIKWICHENKDVSSNNDVLRIIAMDKDDPHNYIYELKSNATRVDEKASFDLSEFELCTTELFLFFENETENKFSPSFHLEIEVPALQ